MAEMINVRDLPEDDVKFVQELVEFLRQKARKRKKERKSQRQEEAVVFTAHPSNVKGDITRREIYDYL